MYIEISQVSERQERASVNAFHYVRIPPYVPQSGFCIAVYSDKISKNFLTQQNNL